MSEVEVPAVVAAGPKKIKKTAAAKKQRSTPSHPKTADMVDNAIKNLKERGGSSLQAIKKYISANYKVDVDKLSPFIKKYLKTSVGNGKLVQTKGKGASGSFKLASKEKSVNAEKKPKAAPAKKSKSPKKPTAAKKTAAIKKPAGEKKVKAPKKKTTPKKPKTPSKVKKATKAPAAKNPKTPKPKKTAAKPKIARRPAAKK